MQLPKDDKGFDQFPTLQNGWSALNRQVKKDALPERKHTVDTFIEKYAPASDNNKHENYVNYFVENVNNAARELGKVIKFTADTPLKTIVDTIGEKEVAKIIAKKEDSKTYKKLEQANFFESKPVTKPKVTAESVAKKDLSYIPTKKTTKNTAAKAVPKTTKEEPSVLESVGTSISNASTTVINTAEDAAQWAKRAMVKQGLIKPEVTTIKAKPVVIAQPQKDSVSVKPEFQLLGDVPAQKNSKEDKYYSYVNKFDRNKGFNYVPIKNVGASNTNTTYKNVAGIAHFILDTDLASNTQHKYAKNYIQMNLKGDPIAKGSTVKNPFLVEVNKEKNEVNIKYKQLSEVKDKSKIKVPLRQLRYTDLDWNGKTEVVFNYDAEGKKHSSFKSTVKSVPVKVAYDVYNPKTKKNEKSTSTDFIFPNVDNGKDSYGKFGGGSVVFLAEGKNFAIDFAGSINQIKQTAEQIIKQENLKPEQLIIAYHDLGSFSAKPKARKNNTLSFYQWSDFNYLDHTGGALAIPINK